MKSTRREFLGQSCSLGVISLLAAATRTAQAADYVGVVQCPYCGTGFRVEWHGTESGYGVYQCPKCNKGSRVHWDRQGVQKVERAS